MCSVVPRKILLQRLPKEVWGIRFGFSPHSLSFLGKLSLRKKGGIHGEFLRFDSNPQ